LEKGLECENYLHRIRLFFDITYAFEMIQVETQKFSDDNVAAAKSENGEL
jgi:hypothetical protein